MKLVFIDLELAKNLRKLVKSLRNIEGKNMRPNLSGSMVNSEDESPKNEQ